MKFIVDAVEQVPSWPPPTQRPAVDVTDAWQQRENGVVVNLVAMRRSPPA
jgi:hypothetical protein